MGTKEKEKETEGEKKLKKSFNGGIDSEKLKLLITACEKKLTLHKRNLNTLQSWIKTEMRQFTFSRDRRIKLKKIKEEVFNNFKLSLINISESDFFEVEKLKEDLSIILKTKNNITIGHYIEEDDSNHNVNLGKFRVMIDIFKCIIVIAPAENNVYYDHYFHPHIAPDGNPCWGDLSPAVFDNVRDFKLDLVCHKLASFLRHYNSGNPHIQIEKFFLNNLLIEGCDPLEFSFSTNEIEAHRRDQKREMINRRNINLDNVNMTEDSNIWVFDEERYKEYATEQAMRIQKKKPENNIDISNMTTSINTSLSVAPIDPTPVTVDLI